MIIEGVIPSRHVDYKNSRIKQYHKDGRALSTETTINNTRDFGIGEQLKNLPALQEIGFRANQRLLDVQSVSQDCAIGQDVRSRRAAHRSGRATGFRPPLCRSTSASPMERIVIVSTAP